MLDQIESFVNWTRRRNPAARTWRDYGYDLRQFVASVGNRPPHSVDARPIPQHLRQPAIEVQRVRRHGPAHALR